MVVLCLLLYYLYFRMTVLVTGASGGVGLAAVELASKIYKCEVCV